MNRIIKNLPPYIARMAPYMPGKPIADIARQFGLQEQQIVKLASNENPLGISPKAQEAMKKAALDLGRYPDPNGYVLKTAIAQRFAVPAPWVTLGNGSNDILEMVAHAFLAPQTNAVFSRYSFAVYDLATQAVGADAKVVADYQMGHDLPAMLAAIDKNTRVVFIANPNNPTGTFLSGAEIEAFLAKVPSHVVVVLDEAYNEYLSPEHQYDAMQMVRRYSNLLVSRSFSKAYGLAGLRVGFALAQEEITDILNRIRQPFNVNTLAQAAAAAALFDHDFLRQTYEMNQAGLQQLQDGLRALQLAFVPSYGNFLLVKFGPQSAAVNQALLASGVIVRPVDNYGLSEYLRISVGTFEENARLLQVLPDVLQKTSLTIDQGV